MRRFVVLVGLVFAIAACGGGGSGGGAANGPAGDPAGAVTGFVNTIKAHQFDKLPALVCAAQKDAVLGGLTGGSSSVQQALLSAMSFDVQNLDVRQTSLNGDNAVVHVTGKIVTTVDANKAKDAIKQLLGGQATDDQVNQMIAAMNTTRDLDSDVNVVKENGGWVVCSNLVNEATG
jgi:hypothetical protein